MRYLLDTHAALWAYEGDSRLPQRVRDLLATQPKGEFVIAYVTLVEIARLFRSGKVTPSGDPIQWLYDLAANFTPLVSTVAIVWRSVALNWEHRDPADRLICATALEEGLTVITRNRIITDWRGVPVLWE